MNTVVFICFPVIVEVTGFITDVNMNLVTGGTRCVTECSLKCMTLIIRFLIKNDHCTVCLLCASHSLLNAMTNTKLLIWKHMDTDINLVVIYGV